MLDNLCSEWDGIGRVLMAGDWTLVENDNAEGMLYVSYHIETSVRRSKYFIIRDVGLWVFTNPTLFIWNMNYIT